MKEVVSILGIFGERGIIVRVRYKKKYILNLKIKLTIFKKNYDVSNCESLILLT